MYITNSFKRIISSPSNEMHKINSISQFKYSRASIIPDQESYNATLFHRFDIRWNPWGKNKDKNEKSFRFAIKYRTIASVSK